MKERLPTFDGESKIGQEVEAWLLGLRKYLWIHDYSENEKCQNCYLKSQCPSFNLVGAPHANERNQRKKDQLGVI